MKTGLVVGKFAPLHKGHQFLLETALEECDRLVVLVYSNPDFPEMPSPVRAGWVRELYPRAEVLVPENPPPNDADDLTQREFVRNYLEKRNLRPEVVFTSESYGEGFAAHLGIAHRLVDIGRGRFPVSGTLVRSSVHAHRDWLDPRVYRHFVRRVVFLGAESTGKSTLARRMAQEYGTGFVDEYGRTLWEHSGGRLDYADFEQIALRQREMEDRAMASPGLDRYLFCDTNAVTTAMFSFIYLRRCPPPVMRMADEAKERYTQVFVCDDDFGFVQDGTRSDRATQRLHQSLVLYDLEVRGIPYTLLSGGLEERVRRAREILASQKVQWAGA